MSKASTSRLGALRELMAQTFAVALALFTSYYGVCLLSLVCFTVFEPLTTGVQMQRRVESWFDDTPYTKRYHPVPRADISNHLANAVVAAEDGGFYAHGGIDWEAVRKAREDNIRRGQTWRGGSTITQQLVKNLFMTTHSSYVRKALEVPLTYLAEWILPKERLLELYLNVIEWGPGVFGAEAAAQHHYRASAAHLSRSQSAALAAVIPSPRTRTPAGMGWYRDIILRRMRNMGY